MCTIESFEANLLQQRKSLASNKASSGNLLNTSTSTIDYEDHETCELFCQARKSSNNSASLHGKAKLHLNYSTVSGASSVTFIDKVSWKKEFNCYICNIGVDKKGVSRHHCRLCGGSVCGGCSDRVVNSQRACDMCFYKLKTEANIKQRVEILTSKRETIENLKITFSKKIEKLKVEKAKTIDQQRICKQADKQEQETREQLVAERIEVEEGLNRVRELFDCLSSSVKKNAQIISEKENKLLNLRNNLQSLKSQISEQRKIEDTKRAELQNLLTTYKTLSEEKMRIDSQKANSSSTTLTPQNVTKCMI